MYTKQNFIDSFTHDIHTIKHLATKLKPEMASYRQNEGQRSMTELLQYLSFVGVAALDMILCDDAGKFAEYGKKADSVTLENFQEAMKEQERMMLELMEKFTEEELNKVVNIYNMGENTKGAYLVNTVGKWFPAYRMQMFIYLKSAGVTNIGTMNMWAGMDMPTTN